MLPGRALRRPPIPAAQAPPGMTPCDHDPRYHWLYLLPTTEGSGYSNSLGARYDPAKAL